MQKVAQLEKLTIRQPRVRGRGCGHTGVGIFNDNYFFSAASDVPVTTKK